MKGYSRIFKPFQQVCDIPKSHGFYQMICIELTQTAPG